MVMLVGLGVMSKLGRFYAAIYIDEFAIIYFVILKWISIAATLGLSCQFIAAVMMPYSYCECAYHHN